MWRPPCSAHTQTHTHNTHTHTAQKISGFRAKVELAGRLSKGTAGRGRTKSIQAHMRRSWVCTRSPRRSSQSQRRGYHHHRVCRSTKLALAVLSFVLSLSLVLFWPIIFELSLIIINVRGGWWHWGTWRIMALGVITGLWYHQCTWRAMALRVVIFSAFLFFNTHIHRSFRRPRWCVSTERDAGSYIPAFRDDGEVKLSYYQTKGNIWCVCVCSVCVGGVSSRYM